MIVQELVFPYLQNIGFLLQSGNHTLDGRFEMTVHDAGSQLPRRNQGGLVANVGQIGTGEAGS